MKISQILLFILVLFSSLSCINRESIVDKEKLKGDDYRLFQQSPAWELAKAVEDEDSEKVKEIVTANPELINYQESKWGMTLLMVSAARQQMGAFKILLDNGADVSIHDRLTGESAMHMVAKKNKIEFIQLLLLHGADPNEVSGPCAKENNGYVTTPLMSAVDGGRIENVKLLLDNGANINQKVGKYQNTALCCATSLNEFELVLFLLENGADFKSPICYRPDYSIPSELVDPNDMGEPVYLVNDLRTTNCKPGTTLHKQKMKIVDFLSKHGVDYKSVPVPPFIKEYAKENYPSSWQKYLDEY